MPDKTPACKGAGIQVDTKLSTHVYKALEKFVRDRGLPYTQDAVRLFVSEGLIKAGYLPQTPTL